VSKPLPAGHLSRAADGKRMAAMPSARTSRRAEGLAWGSAALAPVLLVIAQAAGGDSVGVGLVFSICFPILGALVIRARGSHAVGWLMIAIGVSIALNTAVSAWGRTALPGGPGALPGWRFASWVGVWSWIPGWLLATTLLPVLFPEGSPTGRRRLLARIDAVAVAVVVGAIAAVAWPHRGPRLVDGSHLPSPAVVDHVLTVGFVVLGALTIVSIASLLGRYRRATSDMRRQIAWAVYGAAIAVCLSAIGAFVDAGGLFQVLEAGALVCGVGVAMLRYRLYDIDVVINRTLVYGSLTAALAGVYLASVLLMQLVLSPSSSIAVAVSTLGVAALFHPARAAIQGAVDRRFYRRRYDAAQTLARFGARLRDQVDLRALDTELRAVVRETLQPAHVSLWLRPPEVRR
jgi:hypothetical protein